MHAFALLPGSTVRDYNFQLKIVLYSHYNWNRLLLQCPRNGRRLGRHRGGWRRLRLLRGGRGLGSWLGMRGLSAGWRGVGSVHGEGYLFDLAARAWRWAGAVSTYLRWSRKLISFHFCVFHRHLYKLVTARICAWLSYILCLTSLWGWLRPLICPKWNCALPVINVFYSFSILIVL